MADVITGTTNPLGYWTVEFPVIGRVLVKASYRSAAEEAAARWARSEGHRITSYRSTRANETDLSVLGRREFVSILGE